ncbi:unnamed protein product [Blepharisma stoltei]|uniref:Uncharacterized protein n=1 Tax=Blepharisma stoltei TaxID=1481888 RepID=A0AAU9JRP3_9CILI|nr:unnamed protein product [Blepharisma stoltei]
MKLFINKYRVVEMGNAANKQNKKNSKKIPEFYYLNRKRQRLLHIEPGRLTSSQFQPAVVFPPDSAIGYVQGSCIMVAGGSELNKFITRVALINTSTMKLKFLSPLPIAAKEGHLYEYKEWVYYVGGLSEAKLDPRSPQDEPAPLMRYHINKNRWEYFVNYEDEGLVKRKILVEKEIQEDEEVHLTVDKSEKTLYKFELTELTLRDLLLPGSFMSNAKIYFIGGFIMDRIGRLIPNKQVFSLDLSLSKPKFQIEPFKIPYLVIRPICSNGGKHILITGGLNPRSGRPSQYSYVLTLADTSATFTPLDVLQVELLETCAPISMEHYVIFPNYPLVPVRRRHLKEWQIFDIKTEKKSKFIETKELIKNENEVGDDKRAPIKKVRPMIIPLGTFISEEEGFEFTRKKNESALEEDGVIIKMCEIDYEEEDDDIKDPSKTEQKIEIERPESFIAYDPKRIQMNKNVKKDYDLIESSERSNSRRNTSVSKNSKNMNIENSLSKEKKRDKSLPTHPKCPSNENMIETTTKSRGNLEDYFLKNLKNKKH